MTRYTWKDPEVRDLIRRYLHPEHGGVPRYLRLGNSVRLLDPSDRAEFGQALAEAAAQITPRELAILLDVGWRESRTAAWFIAVARRTEYREQLGGMLLASRMAFAAQGYCVALTCFGSQADADLFVAYLDRYLVRPDLQYDQGLVLGALMYLDTKLETDNAARFLEPGGLWQQWFEAPQTQEHGSWKLQQNQVYMSELCAFADECADTWPSGNRNDDVS